MNGWIILDKPSGISSAKAVAKVKHLLKPAKIGHAGTLDPLASGVLPLALGEATKTVSYAMDASKAYSFTVKWGEATTTDDSEGEITQTSPKRPTEAEIKAILPQFIGEIEQAPPAYSAIKVAGKRAYELARGGETVKLKARNVRVITLSLRERVASNSEPSEGIDINSSPPSPLPEGEGTSTFLCHCGKGTYIRSLARDMGAGLGCYGHITALRRLKVGKFEENHAISLDLLEEMVHKGDLSFLLPVESALDDIPALEITSSQAAQLKQGKPLAGQNVSFETLLAKHEGRAVAICRAADGQIKPVRVFNL